jgi:hypothetical protein
MAGFAALMAGVGVGCSKLDKPTQPPAAETPFAAGKQAAGAPCPIEMWPCAGTPEADRVEPIEDNSLKDNELTAPPEEDLPAWKVSVRAARQALLAAAGDGRLSAAWQALLDTAGHAPPQDHYLLAQLFVEGTLTDGYAQLLKQLRPIRSTRSVQDREDPQPVVDQPQPGTDDQSPGPQPGPQPAPQPVDDWETTVMAEWRKEWAPKLARRNNLGVRAQASIDSLNNVMARLNTMTSADPDSTSLFKELGSDLYMEINKWLQWTEPPRPQATIGEVIDEFEDNEDDDGDYDEDLEDLTSYIEEHEKLVARVKRYIGTL